MRDPHRSLSAMWVFLINKFMWTSIRHFNNENHYENLEELTRCVYDLIKDDIETHFLKTTSSVVYDMGFIPSLNHYHIPVSDIINRAWVKYKFNFPYHTKLKNGISSNNCNILADLSKLYQFIKDDTRFYRIPMTLAMRNNSVLSVHPGTGKLPISMYMSNPVNLSFFIFPNNDPLSKELLDNTSGMDVIRLDKLSYIDFRNTLNLDTRIISAAPLVKIVETNHQTYFEICEDHLDCPGFTTDKDYDITISDLEIYINNELFSIRENIGCHWEIVLHN